MASFRGVNFNPEDYDWLSNPNDPRNAWRMDNSSAGNHNAGSTSGAGYGHVVDTFTTVTSALFEPAITKLADAAQDEYRKRESVDFLKNALNSENYNAANGQGIGIYEKLDQADKSRIETYESQAREQKESADAARAAYESARSSYISLKHLDSTASDEAVRSARKEMERAESVMRAEAGRLSNAESRLDEAKETALNRYLSSEGGSELEKDFRWIEVGNGDQYDRLVQDAKDNGLKVLSSDHKDFISGRGGRYTNVLLVAREDYEELKKLGEANNTDMREHDHEKRVNRMDDRTRNQAIIKASTFWAAKEFTELNKVTGLASKFEKEALAFERRSYDAAAFVLASHLKDSKGNDISLESALDIADSMKGEYTGNRKDFDENQDYFKNHFGNMVDKDGRGITKEALDKMVQEGKVWDEKLGAYRRMNNEEKRELQRRMNLNLENSSINSFARKWGLKTEIDKKTGEVRVLLPGGLRGSAVAGAAITGNIFSRFLKDGTGGDDSDIQAFRTFKDVSANVSRKMVEIGKNGMLILKNKVALRLKKPNGKINIRIKESKLANKVNETKEKIKKAAADSKLGKAASGVKKAAGKVGRAGEGVLTFIARWSPTAVKERIKTRVMNAVFGKAGARNALGKVVDVFSGVRSKLIAMAGSVLLAFIKIAGGIGGFLIILMIITDLLDYTYVPSEQVTYLLYNQVLLQDENRWRESLTNPSVLWKAVKDRDMRFGHYYLPWEDYVSTKDHLVYYSKSTGLGAWGDVDDNQVFINPFDFVPVFPEEYLTQITENGSRPENDPEAGKFIDIVDEGVEPSDDTVIYCRPSGWANSSDPDDTYETMGPYSDWKGNSSIVDESNGTYLPKWAAYTDSRGNNDHWIDAEDHIYRYEGPTFEDGTPFRKGKFGDAGIMLEYLPNISTTAWYGNSGHTSNIKDIICMMDVMFQLEAKKDAEIAEETNSSLIEIASERLWQAIFDFGKLVHNFFVPQDKFPLDATVTEWTHMAGYARLLFGASHQEMLDMDVILFDCTKPKTSPDYLSSDNEELGLADATDVEYMETQLGSLLRSGCPMHDQGGCQQAKLYGVLFTNETKNISSPKAFSINNGEGFNGMHRAGGQKLMNTGSDMSDTTNHINLRVGLGMNGYEKHYFYSDGTHSLEWDPNKKVTGYKAATGTSMIGVVGALNRSGSAGNSEFDHATIVKEDGTKIDIGADAHADFTGYCLPKSLSCYLTDESNGGNHFGQSSLAAYMGIPQTLTAEDMNEIRENTKNESGEYCWFKFDKDAHELIRPETDGTADYPNKSIRYVIRYGNDEEGGHKCDLTADNNSNLKYDKNDSFFLGTEKDEDDEGAHPDWKAYDIVWDGSSFDDGDPYETDYQYLNYCRVEMGSSGQSIVIGAYKWDLVATENMTFTCTCTNDKECNCTDCTSSCGDDCDCDDGTEDAGHDDHTIKVNRYEKHWTFWIWSNGFMSQTGVFDNSTGVDGAGNSAIGKYIPLYDDETTGHGINESTFTWDDTTGLPYTPNFHYKDNSWLSAFGILDAERSDLKEVPGGTCHGHNCRFCGGHTLVNVKGIIFSFTDDEIIAAGGKTGGSTSIQEGDRKIIPVYNEDVMSELATANMRKWPWTVEEHMNVNTAIAEGKSWRDHIGDTEGQVIEGSLFGRWYYKYLDGGEDNTGITGMNYQMDKNMPAMWASINDGAPTINEDLMVELGSVRKYRDGWNIKWGDLGKDDHYEVNQMLLYAQDIFDIDAMIDYPKNFFPILLEGDYEGWTETNMTLALMKYSMSWEDMYYFDIPVNLGSVQLSDEQVTQIMSAVGVSSMSKGQKEAVELALEAVGNGQYSQSHHDHAYLMHDCNRYDGSGEFQTSLDMANGLATHSCTCTDAAGFASYIMNKGEEGDIWSTDQFRSHANASWSSMKPGDILIYYPAVSPSETSYDYGQDHSRHVLVYIGTPSEDVTLTWLNREGGTGFDAYVDGALTVEDAKGVVFTDPDDAGGDVTFKANQYITFEAGEPIFVDANRLDAKGNIYIRGGKAPDGNYFYMQDIELMKYFNACTDFSIYRPSY